MLLDFVPLTGHLLQSFSGTLAFKWYTRNLGEKGGSPLNKYGESPFPQDQACLKRTEGAPEWQYSYILPCFVLRSLPRLNIAGWTRSIVKLQFVTGPHKTHLETLGIDV